jgi:hypothetical protein
MLQVFEGSSNEPALESRYDIAPLWAPRPALGDPGQERLAVELVAVVHGWLNELSRRDPRRGAS